MSKIVVFNIKGEPVGETEIDDSLLVLDRGTQAVHDVVVARLASMRSGNASTLGKSEVDASKRKPWRQKGLGRARAGYRASPVWRGGGIAFGPKPRDYFKTVPRKVARLAFARALSDKISAGALTAVESLAIEAPKTRAFCAAMKALKAGRSVLCVVSVIDRNLALAARNVPGVELVRACDVAAHQLIGHERVIATREALAVLEQRLRSCGGATS